MDPQTARAVALLLFVGGCAPNPDAPPQPQTLAERAHHAVYGTDDRQDHFEVPDAALKAHLQRSVVALISHSNLITSDPDNVRVNAPLLGSIYNLCDGERFADQPSAARCTATLIDDDLVLTAAHCVTDARECGARRFVFNFLYEAPGALAPISRDDLYHCRRLVLRDESTSRDWAIVQLDRPVDLARHTPAEVAAQAAPVDAQTPLILAGFGSGLPMKVDTGGHVIEGFPSALNYFKATTDSFGGHSGAGVFDTNHRVIGVLNSGADDYTLNGTCQVAARYPADGQGAGETATYSHHAIQGLCAFGWPSARLCNLNPQCGDTFCTLREDPSTCPQDCSAPLIPWAWRCNASYYAAGDDCDCDCGAPDPDCDDLSLRIYGCAAGEVCDAQGQCSTDRRQPPDAWTCDPDTFDDATICDCDCGAYDPDCNDTTKPLANCEPSLVCDTQGHCVTDTSPPRPDTWHCNPAFYASGDDCDCNCGAYDPDCDDPRLNIYGCDISELCMPDGTCDRPDHIPLTWFCPVAYYAAGDDCDCACGAYDPDCDDSKLAIINCNPGSVCASEGVCAPAPPTAPPPDDCGCAALRAPRLWRPSLWFLTSLLLGLASFFAALARQHRKNQVDAG